MEKLGSLSLQLNGSDMTSCGLQGMTGIVQMLLSDTSTRDSSATHRSGVFVLFVFLSLLSLMDKIFTQVSLTINVKNCNDGFY